MGGSSSQVNEAVQCGGGGGGGGGGAWPEGHTVTHSFNSRGRSHISDMAAQRGFSVLV